MENSQVGSDSPCRLSLTGELIYLASSHETLIPTQVTKWIQEYIADREEHISRELLNSYGVAIEAITKKNGSDVYSNSNGAAGLKDRILDHLGLSTAEYYVSLVPTSTVEYLINMFFPGSLIASYEGIFNNAGLSGNQINRYIIRDTFSPHTTEDDFTELFNLSNMKGLDNRLAAGRNTKNSNTLDAPNTLHAPSVVLFASFANPEDGMMVDLNLLGYIKEQLESRLIYDISMGAFAGEFNVPQGSDLLILNLNKFFIGLPINLIIFKKEILERQESDTKGSLKHNKQLVVPSDIDINTISRQYKRQELGAEIITFDSTLIYWLVNQLLGCISKQQILARAIDQQYKMSVASPVIGLAEVLRQELWEIFPEYENIQILGKGTPYIVLRFKGGPQEAYELFRFLSSQRVVSRYRDDRVIFDLALYNTQADVDDLLAIIDQYKSFTGVI